MLWEEPGPQNTEKTLEVASSEAVSRGIRYLVIASNSGDTVRRFLQQGTKGLGVVCVTHHVGFKGPGIDEMDERTRLFLAERNVAILTTTHVLAGVERGVRNQFGGLGPAELMAHTLRMFGQGVKVCVEVSVMALDAGLVPYGEEIVAVGGTGRGADTACVVRPAHSNQILKTRIVDILCRPRP